VRKPEELAKIINPEKEEIVGDEEANRFVNIPMRAPWHLPTELL